MDLKYRGMAFDPFAEEAGASFVYLDAGRQRLIGELAALAGRPGKAALVVGESGVGKTALLLRLASELTARSEIGLATGTPLLACRASTTFDEILGALPGLIHRVPVLLLDDVERLPPPALDRLARRPSELAVGGTAASLIMTAAEPPAWTGGAPRHPSPAFPDVLLRLEPLDVSDIGKLIDHRLAAAGYDGPALFTQEALDWLVFFSHGKPDRIVRLCARILDIAERDKVAPVSQEIVKEAAWDAFLPELFKSSYKNLSKQFAQAGGRPPRISRPGGAAERSNLPEPAAPEGPHTFPDAASAEFPAPAPGSSADAAERRQSEGRLPSLEPRLPWLASVLTLIIAAIGIGALYFVQDGSLIGGSGGGRGAPGESAEAYGPRAATPAALPARASSLAANLPPLVPRDGAPAQPPAPIAATGSARPVALASVAATGGEAPALAKPPAEPEPTATETSAAKAGSGQPVPPAPAEYPAATAERAQEAPFDDAGAADEWAAVRQRIATGDLPEGGPSMDAGPAETSAAPLTAAAAADGTATTLEEARDLAPASAGDATAEQAGIAADAPAEQAGIAADAPAETAPVADTAAVLPGADNGAADEAVPMATEDVAPADAAPPPAGEVAVYGATAAAGANIAADEAIPVATEDLVQGAAASAAPSDTAGSDPAPPQQIDIVGGEALPPAEDMLASAATAPAASDVANADRPDGLRLSQRERIDSSELIARGDRLLDLGDLAAARLFYRRAAEGGSASGAMLLGMTYDPLYFARTGVRGAKPHAARAVEWYRQAIELGSERARGRLDALIGWLERAARSGDRAAEQLLETLPSSR